MARHARATLPDGLFHITARGNRRQHIFRVEADATACLDLLDVVVPKHAWTCFAYCLMPNHFHLVVRSDVPRLSEGMRELNGLYAQRFNRQHGHRGHLFQGRFHARVIEDERHLREAVRYVILNPVRAGLCSHPRDWRWSSYRSYLGLDSVRRFLSAELVVGEFGPDLATAREAFRLFVEEALPHPPDMSPKLSW